MRMISLPFQLLIAIAAVIVIGGLLPTTTIALFYTISLLIKELLSFILPFMVFSFVVAGILSFKKNAPFVLGILLLLIFCSNGLVALISYLVMNMLFPVISCQGQATTLTVTETIHPLIDIHIPMLIRSEFALIGALISGLLFSWISWPPFDRAVRTIKDIIELILNYTIIPVLPLFVFGFLLKIRAEGMLGQVMQQYGTTFVIIVLVQLIYLWWFYWVANGFNLTETIRTIRNALPSYITAFGTMSSNATIPVTLKAAEKNTGNRALSQVAVPIMANVHLLGDSISTPILAMATLIIFRGCLPLFSEYLAFVFYFCTAMFAVAGIPGGGILVMIPILQSQLHCTPEMISIITTLYLLLDAFGTAANVMGDGALVIIVNKILRLIGIKHDIE